METLIYQLYSPMLLYYDYSSKRCPEKKNIQLKMFIFEKHFNGCKNISLSSFRSVYQVNTLEHYLIIQYNPVKSDSQGTEKIGLT